MASHSVPPLSADLRLVIWSCVLMKWLPAAHGKLVDLGRQELQHPGS
jgi:hypothetical protein